MLIDPMVPLDAIDTRKARLLAALLLALIILGATSAVVQATTIPNFRPTLVAMAGALLLLGLAYVGSRTQFYRLSAALAAAAPALACIAIGIRSPDDRVWYGFILIAVVFSGLFFSVRTAALVAAAIFTSLCLLPIWVLELRSPARLVPLLALHGILSPLLLIAAHHHAALERETQRRLLEREAHLAEIERLEAFARSTAHVSHDVNNFLMVIDAGVAVLGQPHAEERAEVVDEIRVAVGRLSTLSRSLMTSVREGVDRAREFDPAEVIRDFAPLLSQLAGPSVEVVISHVDAGSRIVMDPLRLEQVLLNLVANARDAMPNGGSVDIRCSRITPSPSASPVSATKDFVAIDVTDTGVGMSEEVLGRIFEPFFTTKANGRGTGLGLAIVREIVTKCGGHLDASSTPGRGSRFRLLLPER